MKKIDKMLILVAFAVLVFGGVLFGAERDRNGRLRCIFVGLTDRQVGERGYLGVVVKPMDMDEHATVLIPRDNERLIEIARNLREGQRLGISFVIEDDFRWAREMEVDLRQEEIERPAEDGERVIIRREIRRDAEPAERQRMLREQRPFRPELEVEQERFRGRESRQPRPEPPYPEQIDAQLREIVESQINRMHRVLREVFMTHLERTEIEMRELRGHIERMERQMQELREENERLRMQLRQRGRMQREEIEVFERRQPDRPREGRITREREVQRDRERRIEPDRPEEDLPRQEPSQEEHETTTGR